MIKTESKNRVICVSLPPEIAAQLDVAAGKERRTRSSMAAVILEAYLNKGANA